MRLRGEIIKSDFLLPMLCEGAPGQASVHPMPVLVDTSAQSLCICLDGLTLMSDCSGSSVYKDSTYPAYLKGEDRFDHS